MSEEIISLETVKQNPGPISVFSVLLILLLVWTALGFGSGYLYGLVQSNQPNAPVLEKSTSTSIDKDGNKVFTDKSHNYSITFDPSFSEAARKDTVPGILLSQKEASIEIWLGVEQAVELSKDQTAALKTKNFIDLVIAGQKTKMTEYVYKNGSYFSVVSLPATDETPLVTFFLKASSASQYELTKKAAQTFKFL